MSHEDKIEGSREAKELIQEFTSARSKYLSLLRQYVTCEQYEGKPGWFTDKVPLWERKPCITYAAVEDAISQKIDLICGEGRYPDLTIRSAWDDKDEVLSKSQTADIDLCVSSMEKMANLQCVVGEYLDDGMSVGTGVAICGTKAVNHDGNTDVQLFVELVNAEWCEPELDNCGIVQKLTIMYGFVDNVRVSGKWKAIPKLFLRVIDSKSDTTYIPVEMKPGLTQEQYIARMSPNPLLTVPHELGFCPVRWYRHAAKKKVAGVFDGEAIHENDLESCDALNFSLSQHHRAALYAGDPQWTETGVGPGDGPAENGRKAHMPHPSNPNGGPPGGGNEMHHGGYVGGGGSMYAPQRMKSPGLVWSYSSPDTKVQLHTLPGDALTSLDNNSKEILKKLEQKFGVVSLDPERMPKGVISGSAMKKLNRRMYASCDKIRVGFGDDGLIPLYGMLLRIAVATKVELPGLDTLTAISAKMGPKWSWDRPPFELSWGSYEDLDPQDEQLLVTSVGQLLQLGLATKKVAVRKLKAVLGIENIDDYLSELEKEQADKEAKEADSMEVKAKADHGRALEMEQTKASLRPQPNKPPKAVKNR